MLEMTITVKAPDLTGAITQLADALSRRTEKEAPVTVNPVEQMPITRIDEQAEEMSPAPAATPVNPVPVSAPPTSSPAPVTTSAPTYTIDAIAKAGTSLVDAGKMDALLALLAKYNIQAVTQLDPSQYGAFATELRGLGAQI